MSDKEKELEQLKLEFFKETKIKFTEDLWKHMPRHIVDSNGGSINVERCVDESFENIMYTPLEVLWDLLSIV